jgi:hypothetical protein
MSNRRRFFASNIEMNMSDHIRNVAETARRGGKAIRPPIPQCSAPVTLIDGVTSFMTYSVATTETNQCQLNKIRLYPYGSFYPIVNYNKYNVIPGDCK